MHLAEMMIDRRLQNAGGKMARGRTHGADARSRVTPTATGSANTDRGTNHNNDDPTTRRDTSVMATTREDRVAGETLVTTTIVTAVVSRISGQTIDEIFTEEIISHTTDTTGATRMTCSTTTIVISIPVLTTDEADGKHRASFLPTSIDLLLC